MNGKEAGDHIRKRQLFFYRFWLLFLLFFSAMLLSSHQAVIVDSMETAVFILLGAHH